MARKSIERMQHFLNRIWEAKNEGKEINLKELRAEIGIGAFPNRLIDENIEFGLLPPSWYEAKKLRRAVNDHYATLAANKNKKNTIESASTLDDSKCIEFLKSKGYKIYRQKTEYEEI